MSDIENLWQSFIKTKNHALKEKLIIYYAPLVKFVAGRISIHVGQHVEFDDLIGYGVFGLIDAIDKFDHAKGVKFETYASFRIRGAIIDHIRKMDWIPRTSRAKNKQLEQIYAQFEEEHGRLPTDEELAAKLNLTAEETQDLLRKASVLTLVSLDDFMEQHYETSFEAPTANRADTPEEQLDIQERKEMLTDAINKLAEKERLVITLYYFENLTLKEISCIMKVSESRVSQIHTKALQKMQFKLGRYKNLLFA